MDDENIEASDDGDESEMGDEGADPYQKEGHTKPEVPDQEMELPEDLNMDGDQDMDGGASKSLLRCTIILFRVVPWLICLVLKDR